WYRVHHAKGQPRQYRRKHRYSFQKAANPAHEQANPSEDNRSDDYGIDAPEELRQYHTECPITYS
ncbi:hypothetical protein, partial [Bacteroides salyersiae]|uniref:hypothetical protein n=1 Tax=Bacteroides salyersiae TaxID=291644 RepID=UPI003BAB3B29